jgi:hypothetical protein
MGNNLAAGEVCSADRARRAPDCGLSASRLRRIIWTVDLIFIRMALVGRLDKIQLA